MLVSTDSHCKWFATFLCEVPTTSLPEISKAVGVLMLAWLPSLRFPMVIVFLTPVLSRRWVALVRAQRRMSKEVKGSKTRAKRKAKVSRIHERIANRRRSSLIKRAERSLTDYGVICVENLIIKNMFITIVLPRASLMQHGGNSHRVFRTRLKVLAEVRGCDPAYTSQVAQGADIDNLSLFPRELSVSACGLSLNRDYNSALNILAIGLDSLGIESLEAQLSDGEQSHTYWLPPLSLYTPLTIQWIWCTLSLNGGARCQTKVAERSLRSIKAGTYIFCRKCHKFHRSGTKIFVAITIS